MRDDALIKAEGVGFAYGEVEVFDRIDVGVKRGEFVGIIGPNGSGKTTFLKLVSGVLKPTRGHVSLGGVGLRHMSHKEVARKAAVVPQESQVGFDFTVFEVVLMGRTPHLGFLSFESGEDVEAARRAMEVTDTERFADRFLDELSGGERQRVIIARALAQEPEVLLLDEPTAFLDIRYQVGTYDLVKRLNRQTGVTVLAVSHDVNIAGMYCERLLLFGKGGIYRDGRVAEVLTPENVEAVYGQEVVTAEDPRHKVRWMVPISKELRGEGTGDEAGCG